MVTLDKIYHAAFVLKEVARKTDLIFAENLSKNGQLYLKTENLQVTGSFKVRGAYYKISQLSAEETERLNNELSRRLMALDNLVSDIGQFASQITDLPALAISAPKAVTITRFDFIYVDANTFIMVARSLILKIYKTATTK